MIIHLFKDRITVCLPIVHDQCTPALTPRALLLLLLLLSVHPLGLAVVAALRVLSAVLGAVELQLAIAIVRVARAKRGRGAYGLLRREGLGEPVGPLPRGTGAGVRARVRVRFRFRV